MPERPWRSPGGWGPGEARLMPSTSPVTSPRQAASRMLKATTARRWRSPNPAACVRSTLGGRECMLVSRTVNARRALFAAHLVRRALRTGDMDCRSLCSAGRRSIGAGIGPSSPASASWR